MPHKHTNIHQKKRRGHHHRRTKAYHSIYLPYLPLVIAIVISTIVSGWRPAGNTLAYATNTSISGLLSATNSQRNANGQQALGLNSQLNNAAQAKANDMTSRNYWSHNTPEGQEPWIFLDAAGYKYQKAGENLAYGFTDSESTVTGWMNSPSHKANMLDGAFTEVGFGFANSSDYNSSGQQTVVVAMYGKPQTLAATTQQPAPTSPAPTPAPTPQQATTPAAPVPSNNSSQPTPSPSDSPFETTPSEPETKIVATPFTTDTPGHEPNALPVTRVGALTGSSAPWAVYGVGIVVSLSVLAFLTKHAFGFRKLLKSGEEFVLHHPLFDSSVAGLIILGITLLQTSGFIR